MHSTEVKRTSHHEDQFWKPQALDDPAALEREPPRVDAAEAQAGCNFIVWVPEWVPNGCQLMPGTLRREARPGRSESRARTPWSENNPSAYRYEVVGAGRRLRIKQFLYDWGFPALDHPCLWRSETRAMPLIGAYVVWFGVDYMKNRAASARMARTMIELSVLAGEFSEEEITSLYRSLRPASDEAAQIISRTPFRILSYWVRYPEAAMVDVPIGLWKFRRPDKVHEGQWPEDSSDIEAMLDDFGLPMALADFHIDSVARFANHSGQSEVEAIYTQGSDRGQELRVIVQALGGGRIEFPADPEVHPCKRSAAVVDGCHAEVAWIDDAMGRSMRCGATRLPESNFKLVSSTGLDMGKTWFLGVAEELAAHVRKGLLN